jgi:hypothetical protein
MLSYYASFSESKLIPSSGFMTFFGWILTKTSDRLLNNPFCKGKVASQAMQNQPLA